jgi:hypothetical protein
VLVAFVHDLHTKVGTVNVVGPSVDNPVFRVHRRLIKVEPVKVEGHGRHAHICQPNAEDGPQGQEKVQGARVAEVRVLEDEAAKVAVCGDNNVLRFLFLSKLVLGVSRLVFGRLANERRGHQLSVHGREQGTAEDTGHAGRVEQVREDVVFGLEDQHEIEGTGDAKRTTITERTLADGVGQEHGDNRDHETRKIHGMRSKSSHSRPMYEATPSIKCMTINWYSTPL